MSWEEPAAREYPAAGQPACDGVPPSLGTVEGTAADVVSDFSVHGGPVDTRPQQLHGALIALVAHIIMERRQDIRPK